MDGICDDVDPCVGELDACDVCNGPGAVYDCGCSDIPAGECDCDGNVLMSVACAVEMESPMATATATGTSWTPLASAAVL